MTQLWSCLLSIIIINHNEYPWIPIHGCLSLCQSAPFFKRWPSRALPSPRRVAFPPRIKWLFSVTRFGWNIGWLIITGFCVSICSQFFNFYILATPSCSIQFLSWLDWNFFCIPHGQITTEHNSNIWWWTIDFALHIFLGNTPKVVGHTWGITPLTG